MRRRRGVSARLRGATALLRGATTRNAAMGIPGLALAIHGLLVCLAVGGWAAAAKASSALDPPPPGSLELIHAETNEGGSSGGHAGLAIGDRVYHFQAADGRLVLARPTWESFVLRYSSLGNRGLRRLPLHAAPGDVARIRTGLERRRLVQARQLEIERALADEVAWLEAQRDGLEPRLPARGAALFASRTAPPTAWARALRDVLERRLGHADLEALARGAVRAARAPAPPTPELDVAGWSRDRLPGASGLATPGLAERLEWREALAALMDMRPLDPRRLIDPLPNGDRDGLAPAERRWLESAARRLERRIAALATSARPDRGRAMLVAVARHRAAMRSLAEDRFLTLDPFDDDAPLLETDQGPARRRALASLSRDFATAHRALRQRVAAGAVAPDETGWRRIEEMAARHHEIERALREGRPVRMAPSPLVPWPRAGVAAPHAAPAGPAGAPVDLEAALRRAEDNLARVRAALDRLDGYDLFRFNCATELATALQAPFGDRVDEALGGRLDADRGLAFIPARLFDRAAARLRAGPVGRIPSYRERRLAAMRERENDLVVWLREGNTLSARTYGGSATDGHFLLFTDQSPALRPLGGAINLSYGVAHTVAGLFTWPFDGGRRLVRGARGVLYSFPELAFFGLRKGSYEYTEEVGARLTAGVENAGEADVGGAEPGEGQARASRYAPVRLRAVGDSGVSSAAGAVASQRSASSRVTPYQ
jgi:hypothetical protein